MIVQAESRYPPSVTEEDVLYATRRVARWLRKRRRIAYNKQGGHTRQDSEEDYYGEAYLCVVAALRKWNPEKCCEDGVRRALVSRSIFRAQDARRAEVGRRPVAPKGETGPARRIDFRIRCESDCEELRQGDSPADFDVLLRGRVEEKARDANVREMLEHLEVMRGSENRSRFFIALRLLLHTGAGVMAVSLAVGSHANVWQYEKDRFLSHMTAREKTELQNTLRAGSCR